MTKKVKLKTLLLLTSVLCLSVGCLDDTDLCISTELGYIPLKEVLVSFHENNTELTFTNGNGDKKVFDLVDNQSYVSNERRMNVGSSECSTPLTNTNNEYYYFSIDRILRTFRHEDFRLVFEVSTKDVNSFFNYIEGSKVDTLNIDYLRVYSRQAISAEQQKLELIINDRGNSNGDNVDLLSESEYYKYHETISLREIDFTDVYESVNDNQSYPILYYNKNNGLVAIEEDDNIWLRE